MIDNYQAAIVQARMEHLSTGGYTAEELEQERAAVEDLARRIGDAHRAEYLARTQQP